MSDLGLTHVALPVRDLEATIAFYARYAHMAVVHQRDSHAGHVVWLADGTRPFVVVLIETADVPYPLRPPAHLGVACRSRAEVDQLVTQARYEGCLIQGPTDSGPPVGYWAFLRDPDGHTLELTFGQEVAFTAEHAPVFQTLQHA